MAEGMKGGNERKAGIRTALALASALSLGSPADAEATPVNKDQTMHLAQNNDVKEHRPRYERQPSPEAAEAIRNLNQELRAAGPAATPEFVTKSIATTLDAYLSEHPLREGDTIEPRPAGSPLPNIIPYDPFYDLWSATMKLDNHSVQKAIVVELFRRGYKERK